MLGCQRYTRAHGDPADAADVEAGDPLDDRLPGGERLRSFVTGQEDGELVTAEAEGLARLAQSRCHLREHRIAHWMAEAVVDALEIVDVDQAERKRPVVTQGLLELPRQPFVEMAVVPEPGQGIGQRQAHGSQCLQERPLVELDREQRTN